MKICNESLRDIGSSGKCDDHDCNICWVDNIKILSGGRLCGKTIVAKNNQLEYENKKLKECVESVRKISKLSDVGLGEPWWRENMQEIRNKTGEALKQYNSD